MTKLFLSLMYAAIIVET